MFEGAMKPYIGYTARTYFPRSSWCGIRVILVVLLLLWLPVVTATAKATAPALGARVYLLRGLMNVFSLGLDEIGTKLQAQGIPVTVANFVSWASLAEEAAAEYKSGRVRTIILVGHSAGATVLPEMLARVSQLGAAVKLAIGLVLLFGPSWRPSRSLINFYIASGSANPSPGPRISVAHCRMSMCRACPGWGTCPSIRTRPMSSVRLMPWCSVTGN